MLEEGVARVVFKEDQHNAKKDSSLFSSSIDSKIMITADRTR